MKIVMTLMVRDEADIVGAMIEHHLAQGIDYFIVTDNGSVDGTTEILERYRESGVLELRHDPVHRKQQAPTVTSMARDAFTTYGADWVLNADADEFWIPKDHSKTLKSAFAEIPKEITSFPVPVIDMIGMPAADGSGLGRLVYRDLRAEDKLRPLGLLAHSTPDVAHIGDATVTVVQGNHFVDLESAGNPPPGSELEVLHLPWRSWRQYSAKVLNAGRAYENNSGLTPSPNHHGMRDYRRLQAGSLLGWYLLRHPSEDELAEGLMTGEFILDEVLATLPSAVDDVPLDEAVARGQRALAAVAGGALEDLRVTQIERDTAVQILSETTHYVHELQAESAEAHRLLERERSRRVVRLANFVARKLGG